MHTSLETLIHPFDREEFLADYWERAPLVVERRDPQYFASLLGAEDVDYLINVASSSERSVELLKDSGDYVNAPDPKRADRVNAVYKAFQNGASVRVNGAQRFWKPLHLACRELEGVFGAPVQANLYCSPPGTQGTSRHYDAHDVFVVQLLGTKSWRIYEPVFPLPFSLVPPLPFEERNPKTSFFYRGGPKKGQSNISDEESGAPVREMTLHAGDVLYLPRGFVHEVATSDSASAHITLGVHVITMLDLLTASLSLLGNRDVRLRTALPPGYLTDPTVGESMREKFNALLETFAREADADEALDEVARSFIYNKQGVGYGTLFSSDDAPQIDAGTTLERRPGVVFRLVRDGETTGLVSSRGSLSMPPPFAPALSFIARTPRFSVGEIPGGLSDRSKFVLARRLIADGFFTAVG